MHLSLDHVFRNAAKVEPMELVGTGQASANRITIHLL